MAEDLHLIRRFVAALVRRERLLLFGRMVLQGALLGIAVLSFAVMAAALRWDRSAAVMGLVILGGVGAWVVVALPLLLGWRASGDRLRQARLVEDLAPALRGRLLASVERVDGHSEQESAALVGLVVRRAAGTVREIAVGRVHPARHLLRLAAVVGFVYLVALPASFLAPGGPLGVIDWWSRGFSAEAAVSALGFEREPEYARVGDLVLQYTYPSYTGLDPKVVSNSTGDVRGPPGTFVEVVARSAEPVEAAGLMAYDQAFDAAVSDEGRSLTAGFRIEVPKPDAETDASYHLVLYRGGEPERSRDFAIEAEEDLAPEVMLDGPEDVVEVAFDQAVSIGWRARDDYGIRSANLMVNGTARPRALYTAESRRAEAFGELYVFPRDLDLMPGDEADLVVVAWDNDTISGSKPGYSRSIRVVVLGAQGLSERIEARQEELLELMVPILAESLVEPGRDRATQSELAAWGELLGRRYAPLSDAAERLWQGMNDDSQDAVLVQGVLTAGRDLIRYTQVAFDPRSPERPRVEDLEVTDSLHEAAITSLEAAILAFDRLRRMRALRDVSKAAEDLEMASKNLQEMLENPDADAMELLARLDQLERVLERLMDAASQLNTGGLQEFLNGRENELQNLMEEIRQAIADGKMDEAKQLMQRLQDMISEMSQGIQDEMSRQSREGSEAMQAAEALKNELKRLEDEQRRLKSEVQALRERDDAEASKSAADLWAKITEKSRVASELGDTYGRALEEAQRPFYEIERTRSALESQAELHEAVTARDIRGSRDGVFNAGQRWLHAWRTANGELARRGAVAGPQPAEVERIRALLAEIEALLDQLERSSQSMNPQAREEMQDLESAQRDLQNQLQEARRNAQELAREFPVQPEGMRESLQESSERMQESGDDLGAGRAMQAEGGQGVAAERLREARESLERAMEQARQQQQAMQSGSGSQRQQQQNQGDESGERGQQHKPFAMEIPGREEFRTPEAYRRALLEGMEGDVPEEYRALKKRYYEELVHQ